MIDASAGAPASSDSPRTVIQTVAIPPTPTYLTPVQTSGDQTVTITKVLVGQTGVAVSQTGVASGKRNLPGGLWIMAAGTAAAVAGALVFGGII